MSGVKQAVGPLLLAVSCGTLEPLPTDAATDVGTTTSGATTGSTTTVTTTSPTDATSWTESGGSSSSGGGFVPEPDAGASTPSECDLFAQDCPRGHKCALVSDDATYFNATRCVPVAPDPAGVGEPCNVAGYPTSGIDDCDASSMCWFVDEQLQGKCVGLCTGSQEDPQCPADHVCTLSGGTSLVLCLAQCDPLTDDCDDDGTCAQLSDAFACVPDYSDSAAGHGTPCHNVAACPDGRLCIGADAHTDCTGAVSCCSTVCDVTSNEDPCPDLDPKQSCESWFVPGMAPDGYAHVGVCALPV